ELQEPDRLAGELVARRPSADDVPHDAVAHEEHLLLARRRDARVEEEAVRVRGADESREHGRPAEDVGVHDERGAVEELARGPEREDRAFVEARVEEPAKAQARRAGADRGADGIGTEAGDDRRLAHTDRGEALEQADEERLAADRHETLRPAAGRREKAFADARGEQDRRHRPSTVARASRKRSKSARASAPMFATRKIS